MIHFNKNVLCFKGLLQFPRLKYHMNTIGIDQLAINGDSFEHKFLNNIKGYINMLVSVITNKHLKIFLRIIWFLLEEKQLTTVLVFP